MSSFKLKSYFVFLSRNKLYSFINLLGFSVAVAVVILLGLYIKGEMSVDKFHRDRDNVFLLAGNNGDETYTFPGPISADLKNRYPEIEAITRIGGQNPTVKIGEEQIMAQAMAVDSSFFSIFSFPFAEGDPLRQLTTVQDVVLTKSFATKIFGNESAVGKTFVMKDTVMVNVCGVVEDFKDTHFVNPDMIIRFEHVNKWYLDSYDSCNWKIYLRTKPGSDFRSKLPDAVEYFKTYFWLFKGGIATGLKLIPIDECYYSVEIDNWNKDTYKSNSRTFIWVLTASMLLILLFAVINYINLSVAQSGFRAKEVSTRRLLGGSRAGLFTGFVVESIVFCAGAFVVGLCLSVLVEPLFNKLLRTDISLADSLTAVNVGATLLSIILLGIVSGVAPAWIISQHQPIEVVRGTFTRKTKMVYSRILITFQYCITIILIGCTLIIMRQTHFMRTTDLGFDKHNIINLDNTLSSDKIYGLRDRLMQISGVEQVSFTAGTPVDGGNNNTTTDPDKGTISFQLFEGDSLFIDILGIEILKRTGVNEKWMVWINESAAKVLGFTDTSTMFKLNNWEVPVAGIVKDFHYRNLTEKIGPATVGTTGNTNNGIWSILVKVSPHNQKQTYEQVQQAYLEYNGGLPFNSGFVDQQISSWYDDQQRIYTIIGCFSLITILIAAMGMLAMATYYMRQRAMDIAVRKVFGSTNAEVLQRVIFSFMRMVAIAFVLAMPVIWYLMTRWLSSYAYRVTIWWALPAAGAIAFIIAFVAVFQQSYKATTTNPVEILRK